MNGQRRTQFPAGLSVATRYRHPLALLRRPPRPPECRAVVDNRPPRLAGREYCRRDDELARLEAVLFVSQEPLTSRKLAQLVSLADATQARTLIRRLNQFYEAEGRAFRVEEIAGGYQLLSGPQFAVWIRRLSRTPSEARLSGPALDTLAVIAYRQPVLRAEIEAVRGVGCGEMLRQLMERDLVRLVGRSHELGRPFLYGTTRRFLQWVGLKSLDDLPLAAVFRVGTSGAAEAAVTSAARPQATWPASRSAENR